MILLVVFMIIMSIWDIRHMKSKNLRRDITVYLIFMISVLLMGFFYFSNPEQDSFSEILLSLIGQEG